MTASQQGFTLARFGAGLSLPVWSLGRLELEFDSVTSPWNAEEFSNPSLQPDLTQKDNTYQFRFGPEGPRLPMVCSQKPTRWSSESGRRRSPFGKWHPWGSATTERRPSFRAFGFAIRFSWIRR